MAPRRTSVVQKDREYAQAQLDEKARDAAHRIAALRSDVDRNRRLLTQTDEHIARLKEDRAGYYRAHLAAQDAVQKARMKDYAAIGLEMDRCRLAPSRRLEVAIALEYGPENPAYVHALREGRSYLRTIDNEPALFLGYIMLTLNGSYWCGGRTLGPPQVLLVSGSFCIAQAVKLGGVQETAYIPIKRLAELNSDGQYVRRTQAYVGDDDVAIGVMRHLRGSRKDSDDYRAARVALSNAGYTPSQISAMISFG